MTLPPFLACLAAGCCQARGVSWPNSVQLSCICNNDAEQSACRGRIHSSRPMQSLQTLGLLFPQAPSGFDHLRFLQQPGGTLNAPTASPCSAGPPLLPCSCPGLLGCVTSPLGTHPCARAASSCWAPRFGDSRALAQWHLKGPSIRILGRLSPRWGGRWCFHGGVCLHGQRRAILLHGGTGAKQGEMYHRLHPCALTPSP